MTTILNVDGMSCEHCVKTITKGLGLIDGVSDVKINLSDKTVTVTHNNLDIEILKTEIEDMGYDLI